MSTMSVESLIARYGAEKIARTRAVYAGYSAENLRRVTVGWRRRLEDNPQDELCAAIVFLLDHDADSRGATV